MFLPTSCLIPHVKKQTHHISTGPFAVVYIRLQFLNKLVLLSPNCRLHHNHLLRHHLCPQSHRLIWNLELGRDI